MTRLPVPAHTPRGAAAAWAWPLAGAVVGALTGAVALGLMALGLPPAAAVAMALAVEVMVTGALHEDGLADTADGFWGGHDRARRLAIMKDSRIGAYGVLALGLSLLIRWSLMLALAEAGALLPALLLIGMLSRAPMAVLMYMLPNARPSGVAASVGRPGGGTVLVACALTLIGGLVVPGGGWALVLTLVACTALARLAHRKIGGQTGDVLGATQQVAAVATLAGCALA